MGGSLLLRLALLLCAALLVQRGALAEDHANIYAVTQKRADCTIMGKVFDALPEIKKLAEDPTSVATLFMPRDQAFEALFKEQNMTEEEMLADPETLAFVVQYHAIRGGAYKSTDVPKGKTEVETALGERYTITIDKQSKDDILIEGAINTAKVKKANIVAGAAIVHIIGKVLIPPTLEESPSSPEVSASSPESPSTIEESSMSSPESPSTIEESSMSSPESPSTIEESSMSSPESPSTIEESSMSSPESPSTIEESSMSSPESPSTIDESSMSSPESPSIIEESSTSSPESPSFSEDSSTSPGLPDVPSIPSPSTPSTPGNGDAYKSLTNYFAAHPEYSMYKRIMSAAGLDAYFQFGPSMAMTFWVPTNDAITSFAAAYKLDANKFSDMYFASVFIGSHESLSAIMSKDVKDGKTVPIVMDANALWSVEGGNTYIKVASSNPASKTKAEVAFDDGVIAQPYSTEPIYVHGLDAVLVTDVLAVMTWS